MKLLAIETSCDETAVAVVEDGRNVLANCILSQIEMHRLYGGVVPELASRSHITSISQLTQQALEEANLSLGDLDGIAVTVAPGLIGALLVGLNFAKGLAFALDIPLIPVHHVRGHIASNYVSHPSLEPPFLCLCVSGGTTAFVEVANYTQMKILGSTRDDAVGECFDKVARVLGLGYPGGVALDKLAIGGDAKAFPLPRSKVEDSPMDLSFSGLKTASLNLIHKAEQRGESLNLSDFAASFTQTVCDTLLPRTLLALSHCGYDKLAVAGGVSANSHLRGQMEALCLEHGVSLYLPELALCGDNAVMIGSQGYYEYLSGAVCGLEQNAFATWDIGKSFFS